MGEYIYSRQLESTIPDVELSVEVFTEKIANHRVIVTATSNYESGFSSKTFRDPEKAVEYARSIEIVGQIQSALNDLEGKV